MTNVNKEQFKGLQVVYKIKLQTKTDCLHLLS